MILMNRKVVYFYINSLATELNNEPVPAVFFFEGRRRTKEWHCVPEIVVRNRRLKTQYGTEGCLYTHTRFLGRQRFGNDSTPPGWSELSFR